MFVVNFTQRFELSTSNQATIINCRLVSEVEEMSGCAHNASGAYGACVELESDALGVCALLQAHHILQLEGTSVATSFGAQHHSIQDAVASGELGLHATRLANLHYHTAVQNLSPRDQICPCA